MNGKVSTDSGVIEYILVRKKVKNLNLRVKDDGIVYVSADKGVSVGSIESFIRKNSAKISEFIRRTRERNMHDPEKSSYEDGSEAYFCGRRYIVLLKGGSKRGVGIDGENIVITLRDINDADEREKAVKEWLSASSAEIFAKMNEKVSGKFKVLGVPRARLRIRRMVSRWGSCKVDGAAVTINSRLIYYPIECLEAVFVHEYAHFLCYYHDKNFYALVQKVMPSYKKWDAILKKGYF